MVSSLAVLKFIIIHEQRALHFPFDLSPTHFEAISPPESGLRGEHLFLVIFFCREDLRERSELHHEAGRRCPCTQGVSHPGWQSLKMDVLSRGVREGLAGALGEGAPQSSCHRGHCALHQAAVAHLGGV